jgi:hypothetical protein
MRISYNTAGRSNAAACSPWHDSGLADRLVSARRARLPRVGGEDIVALGTAVHDVWPPTVTLTSAAAPPPLPTQRISAAGVHYGDCAGVTLAVVLLPEPCGWEEPRRIRVASR